MYLSISQLSLIYAMIVSNPNILVAYMTLFYVCGCHVLCLYSTCHHLPEHRLKEEPHLGCAILMAMVKEQHS